MTDMSRPMKVGSFVMIALFSGAIAYNVFFIQSSLRGAGPGFQSLAASGGEGGMSRMVRVAVRPEGMSGKIAGSAYAALVLAAQRDLAALGFYDGPLDGRYGMRTRKALLAYQKKAQLPLTGRPDQKTIDRLAFDRKLEQAALYTASTAPTPVPEDTIRQVQRQLAVLGYKPGPADGKLGGKTTSAIKLFQSDRGMPATGEIDGKLLEALGM